jgi:mRNA interferase MazF
MKGDRSVRRGCIYLLDISPAGGEMATGESKRRPVLVVQNDQGNVTADTTVVLALSSSLPSRRYPFHVALPPEILGKPGIIMCEQIWTVSLARIDRRALAECPVPVMLQVDEALRLSLGLPSTGT